jgi:hypothetical protein
VYVAILTNQLSGEDTTDFTDQRFRLFNNILQLSLSNTLEKEAAIDDALLDDYIGTYQAAVKKTETLKIYKERGKLYMDLSNKTGRHMVLQPLSQTAFVLPDVQRVRTTAEFVRENGKVTKAILTQEKTYEWIKIK